MLLKKDKVVYHGNEYDAVWVTLEEGEEKPIDSITGNKLLLADYQLWLDIVGEETLNSDREDEPQDEEGERIDKKVYYYDIAVMFYCWGKTSDEEFKEWILDNIIG